MRGVDDLAVWRVGLGRAGFSGQTVKAYAPGCAASPHSERNCRCRTFRTRTLANAYIESQSRIDSATE